MERNFKITIPEPCHEDWNKMTPSDNGRFCLSCSKTVVDFTSMLPDEVQHFFIQNQNTNICGRFKKSQLDTITIQIPSRVLYTQTHYHKMFLLALFIAMGTTLFSCADKDGNKKKIDKVEIIQNDPTTEHISVGKSKISNSNTPLLPPPPPPKVDQVKFMKSPVNNNSSTSKSKKETANHKKIKFVPPVPTKCGEVTENENTEEIIYNGYAAIETAPVFPGGNEQFYSFFANELNLPENSNKDTSKIKISFAVETDGYLNYVASVTAIDDALKQEIIRVLKLSPKWQPGESNGKKIRMIYSLPITFEKDPAETSEQEN